LSNGYKDYVNDLRAPFDINSEALNLLPAGWVKSFVPMFKEELLDTLGCYAEDFYIDQAKEKWAALRVYWHWRDRKYCEHEWADLNELTQTVQDIIYKYADISFKTCMVCGEEADSHTRGYVMPVCDEHSEV
jgi:hypothetical protein